MKPNKKNFCGGNFQEWLEVLLTDKCNGKCSWCIEKEGYHPRNHVSWEKFVESIIETGKDNIILLGGEPTLYEHLKPLVSALVDFSKNVYITTNGSRLTREYILANLNGIKGVNVSIHDYQLLENQKITGLLLEEDILKQAISTFREKSVTVRLNCNLIRGHIDSESQIDSYINFAKKVGVNSIRFAELKLDEENFVNLYEIYGLKYGINNEPFGLGCNTEAVINDMPVNFRLMCGLQTTKRIVPEQPEQCRKQVLYYDGQLYDGWQKENKMATKEEILKIMQEVADGKKTDEEAAREIEMKTTIISPDGGGGCQY